MSVSYIETTEANDLDEQCVVCLVVYQSSSRCAWYGTSNTRRGQWRLPWCNLLLRILNSAFQWLGDVECWRQNLRRTWRARDEGEDTGKGKFVPLYAMQTLGGVEVWLHSFLILLLSGGEWSPSRSSRFSAGERCPGTQWIGGRVAPIYGMDFFFEWNCVGGERQMTVTLYVH